jgi:hypothetical protein
MCNSFGGGIYMRLKITFVNPNSSDEVDKYLPKILAEAVINKITRERNDVEFATDYNVKNSA